MTERDIRDETSYYRELSSWSVTLHKHFGIEADGTYLLGNGLVAVFEGGSGQRLSSQYVLTCAFNPETPLYGRFRTRLGGVDTVDAERSYLCPSVMTPDQVAEHMAVIAIFTEALENRSEPPTAL